MKEIILISNPNHTKNQSLDIITIIKLTKYINMNTKKEEIKIIHLWDMNSLAYLAD